MKKYFKYLSAVFAALCMTACGGSDDDGQEPAKPQEQIALVSQSIAEGAEVDAFATTQLKLTFNKTLAAGTGSVTLNDKAVVPVVNAFDVTVPLTDLEEGKSYTVKLAAGAVVSNLDRTITSPAVTVSFKTKAAEPLPPTGSLVDGKANDKVKALFAYLSDNYGKNILSSTIADVNWNNKCAENVNKLTGKYPAINCYDFIHIYVPKNNWIDYTDITPVKTWADAGGIVSLMWHFNVPKNESATPGTDGSGVTCSPGETTFKAANALKSGTWENKWFYAEMDKVADVILKLQNEGIAAIWRPFHEAAGNTYATGYKGGAWFWWGADGADTFKALWNAMYDHFQSKGIHNLIWVWTAQNTNNGQATSDRAFYPGNDKVDIIARDYYGSSKSAIVTDWKELKEQYSGKMVTLGECGYGTNNGKITELPDMTDIWAAGGKYLYAMPWYGGDLKNSTNTMVSEAWWKNFMSMSNVITRDKVRY